MIDVQSHVFDLRHVPAQDSCAIIRTFTGTVSAGLLQMQARDIEEAGREAYLAHPLTLSQPCYR